MTPRTRRDRGAVIPIVALLLPVLIFMTAFAVDLGRQRADRRGAQAAADIVALDMMRIVNGRTVDQLNADQTNVVAALSASAARNGFTNTVGFAGPTDAHLPRITGLQWGTVPVQGDGSSFQVASGSTVPNAVKITAQRSTNYFFRPGNGAVSRSAIAAYPGPAVNLHLGSVGVGFQPSVPNSATLTAEVQALNARLAAQFGATVPNPGSAGFDLVGYRGLAAANVDISRIAANAGFASPNDLTNSNITAGQFFTATAAALDQQAADGDPNAANAAVQLRRFQSQMGVNNSSTMKLGDMMSFASGGNNAAAEGAINVLDLLSGSGTLVDGDHFASFQLTPSIPGIAIANVSQYSVSGIAYRAGMSVGAPPLVTSQVRLQVNLQVLPLTGSVAPVTIPLVIEAAQATATLTSINCASPLINSTAGVHVDTSGVRVRIGTASDLSAQTLVVTPGVLVQGGLGLLGSSVFTALGLTPLQILGLNLNGALTASGDSSVLGGSSNHTFNQYVEPWVWQRAPGGTSTSVAANLASSMSVSLGGVALPATAQVALRNQLAYVFNNLGAGILDPLLQAAGVSIAGADLLAEDHLDNKCVGARLKLVG